MSGGSMNIIKIVDTARDSVDCGRCLGRAV